MPGVLVRDATGEELAEVAARVSGQPLLQRYGTTAEALARSLASARLRGEGLLVAEEEDGRLGGVAWFLAEGTFALGGYLRLIAVFPGGEGRGVGAALLDEVERRTAAKSRFLFLLCAAWNEAARRFYARRGYAEAGHLPELLRPGLDEVILWKRLPA